VRKIGQALVSVKMPKRKNSPCPHGVGIENVNGLMVPSAFRFDVRASVPSSSLA
jgi:hypothetical protein